MSDPRPQGTFLLPPVSLSEGWGLAARYSYARSERVNQNIFFGTCRDRRLFLPDTWTGDGLLRPKWIWKKHDCEDVDRVVRTDSG